MSWFVIYCGGMLGAIALSFWAIALIEKYKNQ